MSIQRNFERYLQTKQGISTVRGIPNQFARHIIRKGLTNYRVITKNNITRHIASKTGFPITTELHATKGWRTVSAWS